MRDHGGERRAGGSDAAVLPTLWFRNTWSWGYAGGDQPPMLRAEGGRIVAYARVDPAYWP